MEDTIRPNDETETSATEEKCIFRTAIEKYINLLNAQLDSFPLVFNTLAVNVKTCISHFDRFTKENNIKIEKDESKNEVAYEVPIELGKEFERIKDELSRSISAFSLIPKNTVVAMVSVYDAYLADIIECAYTIKPQLLNACEKEFSFSDIIKFGSIENLKKHVLEKDVESIIRESHIEVSHKN